MIFIDQFETLGSNEAPRQTRNLLEAQLSNLAKGKADGVVFIASTRKPWEVGTYFLSFFQERLHIGMPQELDRSKIFQSQIKQMENGGVDCSVDATDIRRLTGKSCGLSGKGIVDSVEAAIRLPLRKLQNATHFKPVCSKHLGFNPASGNAHLRFRH
jgi:vacuolar protein-sorting-associated protein 4